jgi:hypothetical protein
VSPPCGACTTGPSSSSDFFSPNPKHWDPSTPGRSAISLVRACPLWSAGGTRSVQNLQQQEGRDLLWPDTADSTARLKDSIDTRALGQQTPQQTPQRTPISSAIAGFYRSIYAPPPLLSPPSDPSTSIEQSGEGERVRTPCADPPQAHEVGRNGLGSLLASGDFAVEPGGGCGSGRVEITGAARAPGRRTPSRAGNSHNTVAWCLA